MELTSDHPKEFLLKADSLVKQYFATSIKSWQEPKIIVARYLSDLLIRDIKPHQIQTAHPGSQWLATTGKNRVRQIIKLLATTLTAVPLTVGLGIILASLIDLLAATLGTMHALWPPQLTHGFITLRIIEEIDKVQHLREELATVARRLAECPFWLTSP
nr:hypothetical protein [Synechococcus sp. PCC 7336]